MKQILSKDNQPLPEPEGSTFPFAQISTLKAPNEALQTKINCPFGLQFSGKVHIVWPNVQLINPFILTILLLNL